MISFKWGDDKLQIFRNKLHCLQSNRLQKRVLPDSPIVIKQSSFELWEEDRHGSLGEHCDDPLPPQQSCGANKLVFICQGLKRNHVISSGGV